MLEQLFSWDLFLFRLINGRWVTPWLDWVMANISDFDHLKIPVAILVIALIIWGGMRARVLVVLVGILILVGDPLIANNLKKAVDRPRPNNVLEEVRIVKLEGISKSEPKPFLPGNGRSFPSSHVMNNVAIIFAIVWLYGGGIYHLGWIWVALMGYSRIYTGSHYPSDVLCSLLIGVLYCWIILSLIEKAWPKLVSYFPKLQQKLPRLRR
jgi:undecaprenyl-diphosphatase